MSQDIFSLITHIVEKKVSIVGKVKNYMALGCTG